MLGWLFGRREPVKINAIDLAANFKAQLIEQIGAAGLIYTDAEEKHDRASYVLTGKIARSKHAPAHNLHMVINLGRAHATFDMGHEIWTQVDGPGGFTYTEGVSRGKNTLPLAKKNAAQISAGVNAMDYDPESQTSANNQSPETLLIDRATQFKKQIVEEIGKLGLVFKDVAEERNRARYDLKGTVSQGDNAPAHKLELIVNLDRAEVKVWKVQTVWAQINGPGGATLSKSVRQGHSTQPLAQETAHWVQGSLKQFDYKPQVA